MGWGGGGVYDAWITYLDEWQRGSTPTAGPPSLRKEDLASDTWIRLSNRIVDAVNGRLARMQDTLHRGIAPDQHAMEKTMVAARREVAAIKALTENPQLPHDFRKKLGSQLKMHLSDAQRQLIGNIADLRKRGVAADVCDVLLRAIRANPLDTVAPAQAAPQIRSGADAPGQGRRIIY